MNRPHKDIEDCILKIEYLRNSVNFNPQITQIAQIFLPVRVRTQTGVSYWVKFPKPCCEVVHLKW